MKLKLNLYVFPVLILCLWAFTGFASNINLSPLTSIQGLSQNEVRCIHQDNSGFLWVGTQDGLNRYDGYEFKKYARNPFDKNSLSFDIINIIAEDNKNNLWIGTADGLDYFNLQNETFINFNYLLTKENLTKNITSIIEIDNLHVLVSTSRNLYVIEFNENKTKATSKHIELNDAATRIYKGIKDNNNKMWLATNQGLIEFNKKNNTCIKYNLNSAIKVNDIDSDKDGNILLISNNKILKFNTAHSKFETIKNNIENPISLNVDTDNYLWIGTSGKGLFKSQNKISNTLNFEFSNITLLESKNYAGIDIKVIYESSEKFEDILWCGTSAHGLLQYSRSKHSFSNLHSLIQNKYDDVNSYYSIYKDENLFLAGTDRGLYSIDVLNNETKKIQIKNGSKSEDAFHEIFEDHEGNIWVGSSDGLFIKKKGSTIFTIYDIPKNSQQLTPSVFNIKQDKNNILWFGTADYLAFLNNNKVNKIDTIKIENEKVRIGTVASLAFDKNENIWIGTTKGLIIKSDDTYKKLQYNQDNKAGLIDDIINDIFISKNGTIWIATSKGLSKVKNSNAEITFTHYTEINGLLNSYVYGILEDEEEKLWLSTNKGLYQFDPKNELFVSYSVSNGLSSEEFNSGAFYKDKNGLMYFGGINLLVQFNPKKIIKNNHKPQLKIVKCKIDDEVISLQSLTENKYLKIPYSSNVLTIDLASLDFTNPTSNQYAYRIQGLHNEWINIGAQRSINFFNLPYNKSILEFKSSNNEGVWNEENLTKLYINVVPPFWRQWWFYLLSLSFISLVAYTFHRYQLSNKLAIERVRLEENERVRKMASQDLHDEFGNSLTRITILTELIKSRLNSKKFDEAESLLTKISDNSSRLYQGTKDFIWSIRTDSDNLFEAIIRIKDYAEDAMNSSEVVFTTSGISDYLKDYNLPKASSRHIVMILKEAISNTIKHAKAKTTLLSVDINKDVLNLNWKDDGCGIGQKNEDGNGLDNMNSRSSSIGGTIAIQTNKNTGTQVLLTIPIFKNE